LLVTNTALSAAHIMIIALIIAGNIGQWIIPLLSGRRRRREARAGGNRRG
jgi:hypothetical protein